ncbi:MAG: glycogen/starch synthase [Nanoarchaeota archaeon]|nr:glycogen/starch synthase [Nanoarchaeota archaeon]
MKNPKVLYFTPEMKPFAQAGGVACVAGELPPELKKKGVDISVVMPLYKCAKNVSDLKPVKSYSVKCHGNEEKIEILRGEHEGVEVLFVKNRHFEEKINDRDYGKVFVDSLHPFYDDALRFSVFAEACLPLIAERNPDIVHGQDWPTGLLFGRMKQLGMKQKKVLTVHNVGYQGNVWGGVLKGTTLAEMAGDSKISESFRDPRYEGVVNCMRLGLESADMSNAVSPRYLEEMLMPENSDTFFQGGAGLENVSRRLHERGKLTGILNGVKYDFEPTRERFDKLIAEKEDAKRAFGNFVGGTANTLFGFVGRAVDQKFALLRESLGDRTVLEHILEMPGVSSGILASGQEYEPFIWQVGTPRFSGNVNYDELLKMNKRGNYFPFPLFDSSLRSLINLASDFVLVPSKYEPCGIVQLEALRDATPPICNSTGGLFNTVKGFQDINSTGWLFSGNNRDELLRNLLNAVDEAKTLRTKHPEKYREMQWRAFNERFDWKKPAEEYCKMYEQLLK